MVCTTLSFVQKPAREKRAIPNVPEITAISKKTCESDNGIVPLLLKSIRTVRIVVEIPPTRPETKRADETTLVLSQGEGLIAALIPQKGTSPKV